MFFNVNLETFMARFALVDPPVTSYSWLEFGNGVSWNFAMLGECRQFACLFTSAVPGASAPASTFTLVVARADGVNSLIRVILAAGKRVNKSFK
jgi:hypothetical protein